MSGNWGPWVGASGFEHIFHVYGRDEAIPPRQGLYIYCRKDHQDAWLPIYMGEGDLSVCCGDAGLLARIDAKGATHIHMRLCVSPEDRAAELADLLARYRVAFEPYGCNVAPPDAAGTAEVPAGAAGSLATA